MRAKAVLGEEKRSEMEVGEEVSQSPWENKTELNRQCEQEPELDLRGAETQGSKGWQGDYHTSKGHWLPLHGVQSQSLSRGM